MADPKILPAAIPENTMVDVRDLSLFGVHAAKSVLQAGKTIPSPTPIDTRKKSNAIGPPKNQMKRN